MFNKMDLISKSCGYYLNGLKYNVITKTTIQNIKYQFQA